MQDRLGIITGKRLVDPNQRDFNPHAHLRNKVQSKNFKHLVHIDIRSPKIFHESEREKNT
jgi:hypothetical protein